MMNDNDSDDMPVRMGGRMEQSKVKRGRLKKVEIQHLYDEDGNLSGHNVVAHHEADTSGAKSGDFAPSPEPAKTPHETHDSALAKAKEHHEDNMKRFGGKKKKKAPEMDEAPMRAALARKGSY